MNLKYVISKDIVILKLINLVVENISEKWTSPITNWEITSQQFYIKFGDRTHTRLIN
jgi:putative transposase